jgi:hypothetical protein
MLEYIGSSGNLSLFKSDEVGIVIDTSIDMVVNYGSIIDITESAIWVADGKEFSSEVTELALQIVSINQNSDAMTAAGSRMYTIPGGVQAEAKKALKWRKEEKRGGTPVGINTARTLAKGGQIGIEKIRHIAKYFPRHEVDKQGKGWKPGTSAFPSNGRIAWALWGGDAGWRWSEAIVERENKKAMAASAYTIGADFSKDQPNEFKIAHELDLTSGPEFLARVRHDGAGIDRLYKIEIDGNVYVWDDCAWDSLGHVDGDIYTYDASLDDVYDTSEKSHVIIDPSSAIILSAIMQKHPFQSVPLDAISEEEAMLVADALGQIDFEIVDRAMLAAAAAKPEGAINPDDGVDTPAEKAARAGKQVRNAVGRFAAAGQRVAVGGDTKRGSGTITRVDSKNGLADVKLDSGRIITVGIQFTEPLQQESNRPNSVRVADNENKPLDFSGILGEPRTPINQPKAQLPGTLPPLTGKDLDNLINNFPKYVADMRKSYKPSSAADKARVQKKYGVTKFAEAASILAAAEAETPITPENSDVKPKYLAIVLPTDPQAVMDLVAITPATTADPRPKLFKRENGAWVPDEQLFKDLTSATPPDVIELEDDKYLDDVLQQMDGTKPITASSMLSALWRKDLVSLVASLSAAGGLDRNRGNAEELRQYWTTGKGAAKIRWGTPGDWTRCVRNLSKYMGPRAKGYCQLRHKDATGIYTGDRKNPGNDFSVDEFTDSMIEVSALIARAEDARSSFTGITAGSGETGAKFTIPLLIPEELESGDGRKFKSNAIEIRELPLPLMWQIKTGEGHMGSVVVGRIDYMERIENGIGNAYGVFDTGAYGQEAERLVRSGFIRGVSADLDQFEAKEDKPESSDNSDDSEEVGKPKLTINHARVMAATIVAKPAFQECTISIDEDILATQEY